MTKDEMFDHYCFQPWPIPDFNELVAEELIHLLNSGAIPRLNERGDIPAGAVLRVAIERVAAKYCDENHPELKNLRGV